MAEKITKQEAVRRALDHFGRDAKPAQMKPWIKGQFGIEMGADHISTAKGSILKEAGKGKRAAQPSAAAAVQRTVQPVKAASAPAASGRAASIPLDDILYIKGLVGRFGAGPLHTLTFAFAK